jgi:hypothetical protein
VFEKSDRSRALIYRALRKIPDAHKDDRRRIIGELNKIFDPGRSSQDGLDVERGRRRLRSLAANVGMLDVLDEQRTQPVALESPPTSSGS